MSDAQCLAIIATIFAGTTPSGKTPWLAILLYLAAGIAWASHVGASGVYQ